MADVSLDGLDAERINLSLVNTEAQTIWWALETRKRHLEQEVSRCLQANNTSSSTHYEELMFLYHQLLQTTTLMFEIRDDHESHIVPKVELELAATGTDGTTPIGAGNKFTNIVRKWLGVG